MGKAKVLQVSVLAGSADPAGGYQDSDGEQSTLLNFPQGVMQLDADTLLIADRSNGRVRQFDLRTNRLSTWAGVGAFTDGDVLDSATAVPKGGARLIAPSGICHDPTDPAAIFIASDDMQKVLRRVDALGQSTIVAGAVDGKEPEDDDAIAEWNRKCLQPTAHGLEATFSDIAGLLTARLKGSDEELVYMACMSGHCVRSYNPRTHEVKRVIGNGQSGSHTTGALQDPFGLSVDSQGRLLISNLENYTILRYDPTIEDAAQQIECIAGCPGNCWFRDGMGTTEALLGDVAGLTTDPFDTTYFCEYVPLAFANQLQSDSLSLAAFSTCLTLYFRH